VLSHNGAIAAYSFSQHNLKAVCEIVVLDIAVETLSQSGFPPSLKENGGMEFLNRLRYPPFIFSPYIIIFSSNSTL